MILLISAFTTTQRSAGNAQFAALRSFTVHFLFSVAPVYGLFTTTKSKQTPANQGQRRTYKRI